MKKQNSKPRIVRLILSNQYFNREIARTTGRSHTHVNNIANSLKAKGLSANYIQDKSDAEILSLLKSEPKISVKSLPDFEKWEKRLSKDKRLTQRKLWEEYAEANPLTHFSRSFTNKQYRIYLKSKKLSMIQHYPPGGYCQVDYAGDTLKTEFSTGRKVKLQFLVGVSPCSSMIAAYACLSQKIPDFLEGMNAIVDSYGKVHQVYVVDNFKTAIVNPATGEPQHQFGLWLDHHNAVHSNTRVGQPPDKGSVENGVYQVEKEVISLLRGRKFDSLKEVNDAVTALVPN